MNRIAIDRLDLSLLGLEPAAAQGVQAALPGAITRQVQQRLGPLLARHGIAAAGARMAAADLGSLNLPARADPHTVADAIAARLADWMHGQLAADSPAGATEP